MTIAHHQHNAIAATDSAHHGVDDLAPPGSATAAPAGPRPTRNDDAQTTVSAALGIGDQALNDHLDSGASEAGAQHIQQADAKRFANLRANFVAADWALARGETATAGNTIFIASRWGRTRVLSSLDAVQSFARAIGAAR